MEKSTSMQIFAWTIFFICFHHVIDHVIITRLCYQADQPTVWRLFSKLYNSIASGGMSEGFFGKIMKMTDVLVPNKFTVSVRNFFRSCKRPALKNNGVSFSKMADENILNSGVWQCRLRTFKDGRFVIEIFDWKVFIRRSRWLLGWNLIN